jgi:predicted secreted hydrolase
MNSRTMTNPLAYSLALTLTLVQPPPCASGEDAGVRSPTTAWKDAAPSFAFSFPRDHGAHPEYRVEWWYWTGNLATPAGRRFGFQLTFFRSGVDRAPLSEPRSPWALGDLYLAHFAVSDLDEADYHHSERLQRAGPGRAGATAANDVAATRSAWVWNGLWTAEITPSSQRLVARDPVSGTAIDLELAPLKPPVLQGEAGFSKKGASPGNASNYYSVTRLSARGTVTVGSGTCQVDGLAWMDREFGSSFLEDGQAGWDWFALHLDDGSDLMLYQLRREDGHPDPHSRGVLVGADGSATHFGADRFTLTPGAPWTSLVSGAAYPVRWSVRVPGAGLDLEVSAAIPAQEFTSEAGTGIDYWEGAVEVRGSASGRGYLEMTGYAGGALGRALR